MLIMSVIGDESDQTLTDRILILADSCPCEEISIAIGGTRAQMNALSNMTGEQEWSQLSVGAVV